MRPSREATPIQNFYPASDVPPDNCFKIRMGDGRSLSDSRLKKSSSIGSTLAINC